MKVYALLLIALFGILSVKSGGVFKKSDMIRNWASKYALKSCFGREYYDKMIQRIYKTMFKCRPITGYGQAPWEHKEGKEHPKDVALKKGGPPRLADSDFNEEMIKKYMTKNFQKSLKKYEKKDEYIQCFMNELGQVDEEGNLNLEKMYESIEEDGIKDPYDYEGVRKATKYCFDIATSMPKNVLESIDSRGSKYAQYQMFSQCSMNKYYEHCMLKDMKADVKEHFDSINELTGDVEYDDNKLMAVLYDAMYNYKNKY